MYVFCFAVKNIILQGWYLNEESDNVNLSTENKIVYINTTTWVESLHSECSIKGFFSEVLLLALKVLFASYFLY